MSHTIYPKRTGMTLIEVIAGLAILGTLFTAMLFAQRDHRTQFARAQRKMIAVDAADQLLTHWWTQPAMVPQDAHGRIDEELPKVDLNMANLTWRTSRIAQPSADRLNVQDIRLEIFTPTPTNPSPQTPDAFVDVLIPLESFGHDK